MRGQRGFTILELMTVVCVIGVLTMISMTEYNKVFNRAHIGSAIADVQVLRKAIAMYDAEYGTYPTQPAASMQDLVDQLYDPTGQPYLSPPSGDNFTDFSYDPGDLLNYGDFTLTVTANDVYATQITVHGSDEVSMVRSN